MIQISDSLWRTFEEMSDAMGSDREGLINQAMFVFARLNGFLDAGTLWTPRRMEAQSSTPPFGSDDPTDQSHLKADEEARSRAKDEVSTARKYIGISMEDEPAAEGVEELPLFLVSEEGKRDGVNKDRFLIGRGRHCDFVINSGKVSREHAAIIREGKDYFIEDLGSSNGTWFNKQRISRRKIEDGDEYFICNEKIKLVMH
jgi:pSer/pThr/pTyr-binding forkhead associated (FHA) protein